MKWGKASLFSQDCSAQHQAPSLTVLSYMTLQGPQCQTEPPSGPYQLPRLRYKSPITPNLHNHIFFPLNPWPQGLPCKRKCQFTIKHLIKKRQQRKSSFNHTACLRQLSWWKLLNWNHREFFFVEKFLKIFLSGNKGFVHFSQGSINLHSSPGTGQGSGTTVRKEPCSLQAMYISWEETHWSFHQYQAE